jgi:hypothetical protein
MRLTKSQNDLLKLAKEPVSGFSLSILKVQRDHSGVTTAIEQAVIETCLNPLLPLSIELEGSRPWNAIESLGVVSSTSGGGYIDRIDKALMVLSDGGKRPLCLMVDEARQMRVKERELIVMTTEYVARHRKISVHMVLVIGKTRVWVQPPAARGYMEMGYPEVSNRLLDRARILEFSATGIEEARAQDEEKLRKVS